MSQPSTISLGLVRCGSATELSVIRVRGRCVAGKGMGEQTDQTARRCVPKRKKLRAWAFGMPCLAPCMVVVGKHVFNIIHIYILVLFSTFLLIVF